MGPLTAILPHGDIEHIFTSSIWYTPIPHCFAKVVSGKEVWSRRVMGSHMQVKFSLIKQDHRWSLTRLTPGPSRDRDWPKRRRGNIAAMNPDQP